MASRDKRVVDGILLLDKPTGMSSNAALQKVKYSYRARKAGHTGSLDPLASGLLPICFGQATKFSQYLLDADKTYLVEAQLGIRTTTSDAEGEVVAERPVANYAVAELDQVLNQFRGTIEQIPSMYSALKYQGKPLYAYARQGITVAREPRQLHIYELVIEDYQHAILRFRVRCSKGTYVRTLVDDFGEQLGCGAHVVALQRLAVGDFQLSNGVSFDQVVLLAEQQNETALDDFLLPLSAALSALPSCYVTRAMGFCLQQGQTLSAEQFSGDHPLGWVRLLFDNEDFLGIGEVLADGRLVPRKLVRRA